MANTEQLFSSGICTSLLDESCKNMEDVLTCPICCNLLLDPVHCSQCTAAVCKSCIDSWLTKNSTCMNRCKQPEFKPFDKMAMRMLSSIKLKCPYYKNSCTDNLTYDNFKSHAKSCKYGTYKCNFCSLLGTLESIIQHTKICEYVLESCSTCNNLIYRKYMQSHMDISHPIPHTYCKYCGLKLKESLISSHENICDKKAEFMNRCNICEKQKKDHNQNNCVDEMKSNYEKKIQALNIEKDSLAKELTQTRNESMNQKQKIEQLQGKHS